MVACITLCNSACIACIWCFLLSICFPKFVKVLAETESSQCCAGRKYGNTRDSFGSVRNHEIKKENGYKRQFKRAREDDEASTRRHEVHHGRSEEIENSTPDQSFLRLKGFNSLGTLDFARIDRDNPDDNFHRQEKNDNGLNDTQRPSRDSAGKYNEKLIRFKNEPEERFPGRNKRPVVEFHCRNPKKCHECRNPRSSYKKM